ncbi:MAG: KamA family radical SAM protein [Pseudomonadota bacterium]
MIAQDLSLAQNWQAEHWQAELRRAFRNLAEFLEFCELNKSDVAWHLPDNFPLLVPRPYAQLIEKGNVTDPLLLQVLSPVSAGLTDVVYVKDPLKEVEQRPAPGLIHKFHGRVLWIPSPVCAVHCRYCFRQHYPYQEAVGKDHWDACLDYIRSHDEIEEVILSGGDPFTLSDAKLGYLAQRLGEIPHVQILRIHSRFPVVIPSRLTTGLLQALLQFPRSVSLVLHINHPREVSPALGTHLRPFWQAGIHILSQGVLLKGVNDDAKVLKQLSFACRAQGIMPYYLHLLDPIQGGEVFDLPLATARTLYEELRALVPGHLLPKLVREIPYQTAKVPIELL